MWVKIEYNTITEQLFINEAMVGNYNQEEVSEAIRQYFRATTILNRSK